MTSHLFFCRGTIALLLGCSLPAVAAPIPNLPNQTFIPEQAIPRLSEYLQPSAGQRPAMTIQSWLAQTPEAMVQVTGVKLMPTETGLDIWVDTLENRPLVIPANRLRLDANAWVADIPNAVLSLTIGPRFQADHPAKGITQVTLTQIDAQTLQVRVAGQSGPPQVDVTLRVGTLAYSLNPIAELPEEEITITGTRTPRPVRLTPGSISVIDDRTIEQQLVQDLRDLFRYEPNVSVGNNRRYGLQDINIRGLGGNRVLILNDGIRIPTQFQFGTPSLGRDYVDIESLQRVEVVRGPASALYGSDALGGIVNFRTVSPADLLNRFNRDSIVSLSSTAETTDRSWVNTGIAAFRSGDFEALIGYTRRDGFEARVPIGNEFTDLRYNARNNLLGKLIYRLDNQSSLGLTGELFRNDDDFRVAPITAAALIGPAGFRGRDETLEANTYRDRLSLAYQYDSSQENIFLNSARIQVYYQNAGVNEFRVQDFVRTGAGVDRQRIRNLTNTFVDRIIGGEIQLQSQFKIDTISNRLTYGLELSSTRNERVRNGLETRFDAAGRPILTTSVIGADNFPVKDFPDSETFRFGLYIQNEMALSDSLTLIPGLRLDTYQLNTQIDELYLRNPGATAANFSDSAISPSLGLVWQPNPTWAVVARYARGFRTPLYSEINAGFTNLTSPAFRYKTLSNPNLRPETSDTFELGIRISETQFKASLTGFYNNYENFIQTFAPAGVDLTIVPGFPVSLFQSQNVARARTYGLEFSGEYRFSPDPDGFSLIAGIGWTVGDNLTTNQPLDTVDPFKAVVGLRYRAPENQWGADLITTFVGQPRLRDNRPPGAYNPPGYTVLDLVGFYNITPLLTLNVGIFNLLNSQYFLYSDVRPLIDSAPPADLARFAQPGISVRAGLTWRF